MVEDRIGYRYAKSAFSLAQEKQELEAAKADFQLIHDVCEENPDFLGMLRSPIIGTSKKQQVIDLVFQGKFRTKLVPLVVQMVTQKGREKYLVQVASSFLGMYDEVKGIQRGVITSATPLTPETIASIKSTMEKNFGKTLEVTTMLNPDLIGGFKLKVGDSLFDGSVSSALRRLKQELK